MTIEIKSLYKLPSGKLIRVEQAHINGSFSCAYLDKIMAVKRGREFAPGVTLTGEFLERFAKPA